MKVGKFLTVFGLVLMTCACGGRPSLQSTPSLTVVPDATALPVPSRSDLVAADRPSLIGPLDTILVEIVNLPDSSREVQVDASGRMSMPLAGTVYAGGKTSDELARTIEAALRAHFVRDPEVVVNIKSSVSQVATVSGQVVEPGLYPVTNQMTLAKVIASARGPTEFAKIDDVVLLRTVNGRRMAALYNLGAIQRGIYADPLIYANDLIVVGDSPQRRLFKNLVSLSPLLAAPLVTILQ